MEFYLEDEIDLMPDFIAHTYRYGPWTIDIARIQANTSIEMRRTSDPLALLSFSAGRDGSCSNGFRWICRPGPFMAMCLPDDLDVIAQTAVEAKAAIPEVEAFVRGLIEFCDAERGETA